MAERLFGNPVQGRIGAPGHPDPSSGYVVTSPYGPRGDGGFHDGLDIDNGGPAGDPILAMAAGTVYSRYVDPSGALIIRIDHGGGWTTGYAHMSAFRVALGAQVSEGQKIGDLGQTGYATGPHVHMDTSLNNERLDPWPRLRQNAEEALAMHVYSGEDHDHVINRRYETLEGARFRADTNTDAEIYETFPADTGVFPHAKVVGQSVSGSKWWFLAWLYADGGYRLGALHSSTLVLIGPYEECPPPTNTDAAEKAAADKVRDAGVSALNTAAKDYGA